MAHEKARMRREKAARMELTGLFSDAEIADAVGIDVGGVRMMKNHQEYKDILAALKTGYLRDMDADIVDDIKAIREKISNAVPGALQTLIDATMQRSNLQVAIKAAETLIEVDGRFAPVKRTALATAAQGGAGIPIAESDNDIVNAIAFNLAKRQQSAQVATIEDDPIVASKQ